MNTLLWSLSLLAFFSSTATSAPSDTIQQACPLLGPDYPKPTHLSSCSTILNAKKVATNLLDATFDRKAYQSNAIAVEMFSAFPGDTKPLFEYYRAGKKALNTSAGVSNIDGSTIFRVGSISKLFTVYSHLVQDGDLHFNYPVTRYLPELKSLSGKAFNGVDFEDITVGALASQLSGLTRDVGAGALPGSQAKLIKQGLPPLSKQEADVCGPQPTQRPCSRTVSITLADFISPSAGGIYSTVDDLSVLGRSILSSRLLKQSLTNRWLKPASLVSDVRQAVGAPWEILRLGLKGRNIDAYTKTGGVTGYHSVLVLLPDFDVGFAILQAGSVSDVPEIAEAVVGALLPALEGCARADATKSLAGKYEAIDKSLNSSLTVAVDPGPGFVIKDVLSNGSDVLNALEQQAFGGKTQSRIYPTNLGSLAAEGGQEFRIVTRKTDNASSSSDSSSTTPEMAKLGKNIQFPDLNCFTWASVDGPSYGNVGVDHLIFRTEMGKTFVKWPALRVDMRRVDA